MTAYYARVLEADVDRGARHPRRHRAEPAVRGARHRGRARGDPAGDRPGARHARRHHLRLAAGGGLSRTSRSAAPSSARPSGSRASAAADLAGFVGEHYGPDQIILAAAGAVDPDRLPRATSSGSSAHLAPRPRLAVAAGALRRRRAARGARARAGARGAGLRGAGRARRRRLCRADLRDRARRGHVLAAVPGAARAPRALLHHLRPGRRLRRHRADHALRRHRRRPDPRARPSSPWTSCAAPPTA